MSRIVYKVVDENLRSIVIGKTYDIESRVLEVQYLENEWVCPVDKNAPLMAFSSIHYARKFMDSNCNSAYLYKAEAIISKKRWGWVNNVIKALQLKKNKKNISDFIIREALPEGTVFCDQIKLVEKLGSRYDLL